MEILSGYLYFVSNDFFVKIQDPYLKINYENTKRPHYFALKDKHTELYWLVPCSSKVEKFERLLQKKREQHKPTDTIKIVRIFGRETVLLFQGMFPVIDKYIDGQYSKGGQPVRIANPKIIQEMEKNAKKIINLLHRGVRFTPTQPDAVRIEKIMLTELRETGESSVAVDTTSALEP
ncbi:MAG TPA: hypothetical protein H9704_02300 [Candidatus Enterocloster excrementipullorum]|uniref:Uncharacterized protein n=1 Tax=Candidatus Enterocloster excrementipullorum TaxID=2838559 RepID=A0A9D2MX59_9FIRM|nr:hypothetical protein [Candidatus Enterocloster excrementipullorum]